jgi:hypothetical protein
MGGFLSEEDQGGRLNSDEQDIRRDQWDASRAGWDTDNRCSLLESSAKRTASEMFSLVRLERTPRRLEDAKHVAPYQSPSGKTILHEDGRK